MKLDGVVLDVKDSLINTTPETLEVLLLRVGDHDLEKSIKIWSIIEPSKLNKPTSNNTMSLKT